MFFRNKKKPQPIDLSNYKCDEVYIKDIKLTKGQLLGGNAKRIK